MVHSNPTGDPIMYTPGIGIPEDSDMHPAMRTTGAGCLLVCVEWSPHLLDAHFSLLPCVGSSEARALANRASNGSPLRIIGGGKKCMSLGPRGAKPGGRG